MIAIGCTGGIGSGKSTVAHLLGAKGAVVLDADSLARRALGSGGSALAPTIARFGKGILAPDGTIDRGALAAIVFADPEARHDLEGIVHPIVRAGLRDRLEERRASGDVVVLDIPLLVETGGREAYDLDGVLVVTAPQDLAIERLVRDRAMDPTAARARIAAQAAPEERHRAADFIIVNSGTLEELGVMVDNAWAWIERLASEREERSPSR